jgi:hypothetical protein
VPEQQAQAFLADMLKIGGGKLTGSRSLRPHRLLRPFLTSAFNRQNTRSILLRVNPALTESAGPRRQSKIGV